MSRNLTSPALVVMKLLAGLDVVAHQDAAHLVGQGRLVDGDLQQRAAVLGHRGDAELLPVHLAETLQTGELAL